MRIIMKNKIDIPILSANITGSIEIEVITLRISDKVKAEKYFKNDTESEIVDNIYNI